MKKLDIEDFIRKAREIHGDKFDYSKSVYINSKTNTIVTCRKHGDFTIKPSKHLLGQGCQKCYNDRCSIRFTKSVDQFVEDARRVHGDKFDYSLVEYRNQYNPIKIICPIHGVFEQRPKGHVVDGCGCAKCSREENSGWTTNDWKRKLKDGRVLKLYYIECWDDLERFYKIGLTCKNKIEDRFCGTYKMPYNYRIIKSLSGDVEDLVKLERDLKRKIIDLGDKYLPKIKFSGCVYECFGGKFIPDFREIVLDQKNEG